MSIPDGSFLDTTLRPLCFPELGRVYTPGQAKSVGPQQFKRYEYILYLMAQLSRIVYCDTGVQWEVIQKGLGLSNDVVNKLITYYDSLYASEAKIPMPSPPGLKGGPVASPPDIKGGAMLNLLGLKGRPIANPPELKSQPIVNSQELKGRPIKPQESKGRPMKSYIVKSQPDSIEPTPNYATYISTGHDVTCLLLDATAVKPNSNSILTPNDVIVTFKGSSTIKNFIDDAKSMKPTDFSAALKQIGLNIADLGNVAGGFVFPLLHAISPLMTALNQRLEGKQSPRVFITGHSLGGAYATLFGWILALMKKNGTLQTVNSLHIVTYGAPLVFSDTARNQFNALLDEGVLTFDRVVSQQIASVKSQVAGTLGKSVSGADIIPTIPPGFSHPGFQPLITEFFPEKGGRPYGFQNIRQMYGVANPQRYREPTTWPFEVSGELGNIGKKTNLATIVSQLTGASPTQVAALKEAVPVNPANVVLEPTQKGGLFGFGEEKTKYEEQTKKHIPNFVSVVGSKWALAFPHAEYMGLFFAGAMRTYGRKNPVPTGDFENVATFYFTGQGVSILYNFKKIGSNSAAVLTGGRRRKQTRKVKKFKKRHTRKH